MKRVIAVLLAFLFAYWGQRSFAQNKPLLDGVILYALGVLCLLAVPPRSEDPDLERYGVPLRELARQTREFFLSVVARRRPALSSAEGPAVIPASVVGPSTDGRERFTKTNLILIGLGAALALFAARLFQRDVQTNEGLILWLVGMALFSCGFWRAAPRRSWRTFFQRLLRADWREVLILVLILAVALFMRAYRLDEMPPAVYLDEGDNGLEAIRLMAAGTYVPFTRASNGHPTFYLYLVGLAFRVFGGTPLVMRWVGVLAGVATVFVFYLLVRQLYGFGAAAVATFLLAVSRWHITYSRIAFEGILTPLFAVLTFYFLVKAVRTGRRGHFAAAGLALGLGLNTYVSFRVVPVVALFYLAHCYLVERRTLRRPLTAVVALALATVVAFGPLGAYFLRFPQDVWHRARQASVTLDIERAGSYEPLRQNIKKTLLMFNYRGDPRPRHNLPDERELDFGTAMLFLLGVGYSLYHWKQSRYFVLLVWLLLGLLPGMLSLADSNPHSLRTIASLPAAFLLAAVTADRAWEGVAQGLRGQVFPYRVGLAVVLLILVGRANYVTYFNQQAQNESVYYDYDPIQTEVAKYIKAMGNTHRVYVSRYFTNHADVKFISYGVPYYDFDLNAHLPLREQVDQDVLFILERNHAPFVTRLQQLYPQGIYHEVDDRYGRFMYYTFLVPKEEIAAIQGLQGSYYASAEPEGAPVLQRKDATIAFYWSADGPAFLAGSEEPFSATWEGSLYVPRFGDYAFVLDTDGLAQLWLDEELVVESSGERVQGAIQLPAGFHAVALNAAQQRPHGRLTLNWIPAGSSSEQVVPQTVLYTAQLARQGLLGRYYHGTNWSGVPVSIQLDSFIAPNDVIPSPFSIQWEGRIYAPTTGNYVLATNSDDGSLLYIDGQLVVDNGGHHGDRYIEGRMTLEEGFHDIILRYFQDGGGRKIELWWIVPGRGKEQVPAEFLTPPSERLPELPTFPVPSEVEVVQEIPEAPIPEAGPLGEVRYLSMWGGQGTEPGQFQGPRGIAVDRQRGQVYVVDTGNKRVQVFELDGGFIAVWDRSDESFEEPFDVVVDSQGEVYVLDALAQFIQRYGPSGELRGAIGRDLGFFRPRGLAIDGQSNLYVADTGNNRIVKITPAGQQLGQFGSQGSGAGQLNQLTDVAVDASGRMYVADTYNQRVQVLDSAGRYVREWPINGANTFDSPHIQLGPGGQVFITDPEAHVVIAYDGAGRPLGQWGGFGTAAGQFHKPISLAFDGVGRMYVTDAYNHRVQVFEVAQ
jgi:DNA-binding beta-propeller fold protein YncE/4-amino-4-deoxy-L-arabinose transferase-like glycosyltransferase